MCYGAHCTRYDVLSVLAHVLLGMLAVNACCCVLHALAVDCPFCCMTCCLTVHVFSFQCVSIISSLLQNKLKLCKTLFAKALKAFQHTRYARSKNMHPFMKCPPIHSSTPFSIRCLENRGVGIKIPTYIQTIKFLDMWFRYPQGANNAEKSGSVLLSQILWFWGLWT